MQGRPDGSIWPALPGRHGSDCQSTGARPGAVAVRVETTSGALRSDTSPTHRRPFLNEVTASDPTGARPGFSLAQGLRRSGRLRPVRFSGAHCSSLANSRAFGVEPCRVPKRQQGSPRGRRTPLPSQVLEARSSGLNWGAPAGSVRRGRVDATAGTRAKLVPDTTDNSGRLLTRPVHSTYW